MENRAFEDDENYYQSDPKLEAKRILTFDEAAALCGNGKYHMALFMICGLCLLTLMTSTISVGFYIMFAKCDLDISVYEQGLLSSAAFIGIVVSSHTWGFLSDTWGRLKIIRISIYGAVTFTLISAFSYSTWMLILLRFLVGTMLCGTQSSIFSYLSEFHSSKTRTQTISFLTTFLSLSLIFLPVLAIAILPLEFDWMLYGTTFSSWRLFEMVSATPGILASFVLPFVPESPKYLFTKGDHEGSLKVLRLLYRWNTGNPEKDFPVDGFSDSGQGARLKEVSGIWSALKLVWNQTIPMFNKSRIFVSGNLLAHIFVAFFVAHGVFMWFPEILTAMVKHMEKGMTICEIMRYEFEVAANETGVASGNLGCATNVELTTYQAMIVMGLAFTVAHFTIGYVIKAIGKKQSLSLWLVTAGISGICILWSRNFYLTMFLFTMFLLVGVCGAIVTTISIDYYPTSISAMAMCLLMMTGRMGVVAGSNSMGLILHYNCETIFYGPGSILLAMNILTYLLPNDLSENKIDSNLKSVET